MDVITAVRELGKAIQASEEFAAMEDARKKSDANPALQEKISNFNLKKIAINHETTRENRDNEKIAKFDAELREIYQSIMQEEDMIAYSDAKKKVDVIMKKIEYVLAMTLNGENPETIEIPEGSACSGNCSECGSCH